MAARAPRCRRRGQAGVTLIELMIALVVQSIFVIFIIGLYGQMSSAYQGQSRVAEVQMTLQAARETILPEIGQAGFAVPQGFRIASGGVTNPPPLLPLSVVNNADASGVDHIRFYYGDPSAQARVVTFSDANRQFLTVDFIDNFQVGDVAVIVNATMVDPPAGTGTADIAVYEACVVRVTGVTAGINRIDFSSTDPIYNESSNNHCAQVQTNHTAPPAEGAGAPGQADTMLYRFVGRSYRIDPLRKDLSVLQMSESGEIIAGDWVDMGIGFTDMQLATRFYEEGDAVDRDGDGDPERDWYSGEAQEEPDPTGLRPGNAVATQISVSFAVRTSVEVSSVPTSQTPAFTTANTNFNRIGDRPSLTLVGVPDASRPEEHRGNHIYRFSTTSIDTRNLGVGR